MNYLPTNSWFDASLHHSFIGFKFEKDTHSQCKCPLNNWCHKKWRNIFNLPNFECKNHSMTPQALIDHMYAIAYGMYTSYDNILLSLPNVW